jgi:hypothetical protein
MVVLHRPTIFFVCSYKSYRVLLNDMKYYQGEEHYPNFNIYGTNGHALGFVFRLKY